MSIDLLLSKLDGVRKTGAQTWVARCPSHADKNPSLALRETKDERILLHCFAGCCIHDVLAALGLEADSLFPDKLLPNGAKPERRPFPAADVLRCLSDESMIVASCAVTMLDGRFTQSDRERLIIAASRIQAGITASGVRHG